MPRRLPLCDGLTAKISAELRTHRLWFYVQLTTILGVIYAVVLEDPVVRKIDSLISGHLLANFKCAMHTNFSRLSLGDDPVLFEH
jgi:hypothetical protein